MYGGTERVVSYLTEECGRRGHEVTLFASGDSVTAAKLRSPCRRALRLEGPKVIDQFYIRARSSLADARILSFCPPDEIGHRMIEGKAHRD